MPSVKVCLWNIQNFGQATARYDGVGWVLGNAIRNQFIARLVWRNDIDVLMIQETQLFSFTALQDLQRKLNAVHAVKDWAYSSCGSAIRADDVQQAQTPFDLTMMTGARTEGYAVLWRRNQAARFQLVDGLFPIADATGPADAHLVSPLNISELGRPTGQLPVGRHGGLTFGATGGFTLANPYPYLFDEDNAVYDLQNAWPKLNYPPTSKSDFRALKWAQARRPVYVVLKLGGDQTNLCPVAAYHAPSNLKRSSWGAFISGLSREMYATNTVAGVVPNAAHVQVLRKTVFGGDFNNSVAGGDWPGDYRYFTVDRLQTYAGGARADAAPPYTDNDADRRTTVQIIEGPRHDEPIDSDDPNAYLRHKIDLVFFPKNSNITAERIDLIDEVLNYVAYEQPIKNAWAVMNDAAKSVTDVGPFIPPRRMTATGPEEQRLVKRGGFSVQAWVPMICGSWGGTFIDWNESRSQFRAGDITDARRAAEYIHLFVSDHLPLVATVTF